LPHRPRSPPPTAQLDVLPPRLSAPGKAGAASSSAGDRSWASHCPPRLARPVPFPPAVPLPLLWLWDAALPPEAIPTPAPGGFPAPAPPALAPATSASKRERTTTARSLSMTPMWASTIETPRSFGSPSGGKMTSSSLCLYSVSKDSC
jgi:hypothetical protein